MIPTQTIYMRDLFLLLKRKNGPSTDLKGGVGRKKRARSQTMEVDEEEETLIPLRERKTAAPQKRKQTNLGSMSTPKKTKVFTLDARCISLTSASVLMLNCPWSLQAAE